jgi:sugar phosphate isomerase/epimerase
MQRRSFLKTAALSAAGIAVGTRLSFAAEGKRIPISVQVYSVRQAAEKNLAETLKGIAQIGYEAVEFAGYYGKDAKEIRKILDGTGLKCSGTHTGIGELSGDKFAKTVEIHKILGTANIIVPWIDPKEFKTVDGIKKIADEFAGFSEKAKRDGMTIGYHAHAGDAQVVEGKTAFERFFEATPKDVIMEIDLGNYMSGGGDPYAMLEKFPGRSKAVHIKELGTDIIGEGKVDWKRAFNLCETVGGTEWYVVEAESVPDKLDIIDQCWQALKKMGKTK